MELSFPLPLPELAHALASRRQVSAKHMGGTVHVDVAATGTVEELRASFAHAIGKPAESLILVSAGRKLNNDRLLRDALPSEVPLMLLCRSPAPQPRLTLYDHRRSTVVRGVEVPTGASVAELIALARRELAFPISILNASLYSSHLNMLLDPDRLVADYRLPHLSSAYLMPGASTRIVPLVPSRLRPASAEFAENISHLTPLPSPLLKSASSSSSSGSLISTTHQRSIRIGIESLGSGHTIGVQYSRPATCSVASGREPTQMGSYSKKVCSDQFESGSCSAPCPLREQSTMPVGRATVEPRTSISRMRCPLPLVLDDAVTQLSCWTCEMTNSVSLERDVDLLVTAAPCAPVPVRVSNHGSIPIIPTPVREAGSGAVTAQRLSCRACMRTRNAMWHEQGMCKCRQVFCSAHLFSHECAFDHRRKQREWIFATNPKVAPAKLEGF